MTKSRALLTVFLALVFGLSVAVPAEDIPETTYDESETLPYEGTPVFRIALSEAVVRGPGAWACTSLQGLAFFKTFSRLPREHGNGSTSLAAGSLLTILVCCCFRC